jgi:type IV secretory pathway VirD2 relaxase
MGPSGTKAARLHLSYIQRDGVGEAGEAGVLYGRDGSVEPEHFGRELPREERQFRFIIAPEDGPELELQAFTRRLMAQMEADLGRRLEWAASDHHNTDNPHTHVIIRGLDRDGRDLRIDGDYIKSGFRNRASEFATEELGLRSERQMDQQLEREVAQQRFTGLDREILQRAPDGRLDLSDLHTDKRLRTRLVGRIGALEAFGFAQPEGGPHWRLTAGWDATLRKLGEHGDIIKRLHQGGLGSNAARVEVFPAHGEQQPQAVEGIIKSKGLHDELRGTIYAVVETVEGRAYYVQLPRGKASERKIGEIIRATVEPTEKGRRLVVHCLDSRALGAQESYSGPTWLDQVSRADVKATSGFGAAIATALTRRDRHLATLGLDPSSPQLNGRLRLLERRVFGEVREKLDGGECLRTIPKTFTGTLELHPEPLPSGQRVTVLRDSKTGAFLVLPRAKAHRDLNDQRVTLRRDETGRPVLSVATPDLER